LIRIVVDTNILISAFLFGGKPEMVLERALLGQVSLVASRDILDELEGVLCGRKFRYPPEIARSIVREVEAMCEIVAPTRSLAVVKADPYDNMVLECAVEARVDYVVSGDSHLLKLERFEDIPILSPAQFLKVVES
jgi:putative PIN family toxin of toxin-antitoxin system